MKLELRKRREKGRRRGKRRRRRRKLEEKEEGNMIALPAYLLHLFPVNLEERESVIALAAACCFTVALRSPAMNTNKPMQTDTYTEAHEKAT